MAKKTNKNILNADIRICKISDEISIPVNMGEDSVNKKYLEFCDNLKLKNLLLNEVSEEDKLKLFMLTQFMDSSFLDKFVKNKNVFSISNSNGEINIKSLCHSDLFSREGKDEETWRHDNRSACKSAVYLLRYIPFPAAELTNRNKDFVYDYLMNGSSYKWTRNTIVARIVSSCVTDVTIETNKCNNEDGRLDYYGKIDWKKLRNDLKLKYGVLIKTSRAKKSNIWEVYVKILYSIFLHDVEDIIAVNEPIKDDVLNDNALVEIMDEIRRKFDIEIHLWQIKGMINKHPSIQNLYNKLVEIISSKAQINPWIIHD